MIRKEKLLERISKFLEERKESDCDGWAPVAFEEMKDLCGIVEDMIRMKWEADADGDVPVEFDLVDRTRFERSHFRPQPYEHKAETLDAKDDCLDIALLNMHMAVDKVNTLWKIRQFDRNKSHQEK